ncbi:hypothetical protein [Haloferula sp. A504]|uniref:hypothetical protein n=1 Tax=Haloferula sp. A504 TaxID=3373601 RepID=UPI0031BCC8E5|nr:hypothetical protein [Verrucomicrobiaceae bacterium E54]
MNVTKFPGGRGPANSKPGSVAWRGRHGEEGDRGCVDHISLATVSKHMQRVYDKLRVTTNTGAVAKALREKRI